MIQKIFSLEVITKEDAIINTNNHFSCALSSNKDKPLLICFSMEGCPDCKAADEVIEQSEDIKNNYDIVRIYRSNSKEKHDYTDVYELYRHIYDINWYPSFIILEDGTYRFIGEVPLNELADLILSH